MRLAAARAVSGQGLIPAAAPRLIPPHTLYPKAGLQPNPNAKNIAILGGGITGLATAYHLAQKIPHAKISVFERGSGENYRYGGWVDSERINVGPDQEVLFEWGPRSLRPDLEGPGLATMYLLSDLCLSHDVIFTKKSQPAAQNRFLYYPDRLTRMPSPYGNPIAAIFGVLKSLFTDPVFKGLGRALIQEPQIKRRPQHLDDESVGDFLRRRFGMAAADNLASALFHGIYAGDVYQLSARTCLPMLWYLETRDPDGMGIVLEQADILFKGLKLTSALDFRFAGRHPAKRDVDLRAFSNFTWPRLVTDAQESAIYTLTGGLAHLVQKLAFEFNKSPNTTLYKADVQSLSLSDDSEASQSVVRVQGEPGVEFPSVFDYVVSTLSPGTMAKIMRNAPPKTKQVQVPETVFQKVNKSATVMVVNLYYDDPSLIPDKYAGFGYLIPRSVALDQNPERALGVIFGSMSSGPRGPDISQYSYAGNEEMKEEQRAFVESEHKSFLDSRESKIKQHPEITSDEKLMGEMDFLQKTFERTKADLIKHRFPAASLGQDTAKGTKLTVMIGGHWWDGWLDTDFPTEEQGITMARKVLKRHLDITDEPRVAKAKLQRDCIPQYPVGYRQYMAKIHKDVLVDQFKGKLKMAGPWWQGAVGVNDCMRRARETAWAIEYDWNDHTGLQDFVGKEKWMLTDKQTGQSYLDPMCED